MLPYYLFLLFVVIFAYFSGRLSKHNLLLLVTLLIMVLFAGLRDSSVGTDSGGYARGFVNDTDKPQGSFREQLTDEAGFFYLRFFLQNLSTQYAVFFVGIALLAYSCVFISIKRETDSILIPLFVYITLGLSTFVFNASRQGIAVGIYMLSFKYLTDKGFLKYCFIVCLAALFHKSVVIALPLYFLFRIPFSKKNIVLIIVIGMVVGVLLPRLLSFAATLENRYAFYDEYVGGGEMLTAFYVLISLFFILWRRNIDEEYLKKYDIFLNMMLFGSMIFVVVQVFRVYVELTRFSAYFQVASIFLWLYTLKSKKRPNALLSAAIICGHLLYYYIYTTKMANLVPYTLNQTLFQI